MRSVACIAPVMMCLFIPVHALGNDESAAPEAKTSKPHPTAKSHEELGKLLSVAFDSEDYEAVAQLMAPNSLLKEMGASKSSLTAHANYVSGIPALAKHYRAYIARKGLLPLATKSFQKFDANDRSKRKVNGKTFQHSTGLRIIDERGIVLIELIDQAIAVDDRWYILRLCDENVENELKNADNE